MCHGRHAWTRSRARREVSEDPYTRASQVDRQQNRRCGVGCGTETKPRLRVKRSRVAYREYRDRETGRVHDRGLGKYSGRFRKHPHGIRVRKVLENPGHTPAAESSGCCWRQCRATGVEAAGVCWSWGWCSWRRPEDSGQCWSAGLCSRVSWHCSSRVL